MVMIFFFVGQEQREGFLCLMQGCRLQIQHANSSPTKDYAIHDYFSRHGFSFQQLGGVRSNPTKGIPFSSL
jgi:hypothetical protein